NAVKTQVWIAICVYVLVAIVRKELGLEASLSQILQVLSVNVFEQMPLAELVAKTASQNKPSNSHNQLVFNIL
ncbi:MAG: IS4 family transposase, partial [Limisphaerales bacterium]